MTYSIVARDRDTGEMGVATQSQAFAVGSSVPFALPGHGVVATQSMGEPMYGEIGLDLLRGGFTAQGSLTALFAHHETVALAGHDRGAGLVDGVGAVGRLRDDDALVAHRPRRTAVGNRSIRTGVLGGRRTGLPRSRRRRLSAGPGAASGVAAPLIAIVAAGGQGERTNATCGGPRAATSGTSAGCRPDPGVRVRP